MKVAYVTSTFLPSEGGIERYTYYVAREMVRRGHEAVVFTLNKMTDKSQLQGHFLRSAMLDEYSILDGIKVLRYPYVVFPLVFRGGIELSPTMSKNLLKERFDVLHLQGIYSAQDAVAAMIARVKGISLVFTAHGILEAYSSEWIANMIGTVIRLSNRVVCQTRQEVTKAAQLGVPRKNIILIPNGVDAERFAEGLDEHQIAEVKKRLMLNHKVILTTCSILRMKGLEYAIEAVKLLGRRDINYVIAGPLTDRVYFKELKSLCKRRGLSQIVKFTGWIDDDLMKSLYFCSDVFVAPFTGTTASLVVLEAMATGLPVVATRVGGFLDMIEDQKTGYLVEPRSAVSLAQCVSQLLSDDALRSNMGMRGRLQVLRERSWTRIADKLLELYQKSKIDVEKPSSGHAGSKDKFWE